MTAGVSGECVGSLAPTYEAHQSRIETGARCWVGCSSCVYLRPWTCQLMGAAPRKADTVLQRSTQGLPHRPRRIGARNGWTQGKPIQRQPAGQMAQSTAACPSSALPSQSVAFRSSAWRCSLGYRWSLPHSRLHSLSNSREQWSSGSQANTAQRPGCHETPRQRDALTLFPSPLCSQRPTAPAAR